MPKSDSDVRATSRGTAWRALVFEESGWKTAVDFYDAGDCALSLGVVDMMAPSVETWQVEYRSEEIWADFELLLDLRDNVQSSCADTPVPPNWFEGSCFGV